LRSQVTDMVPIGFMLPNLKCILTSKYMGLTGIVKNPTTWSNNEVWILSSFLTMLDLDVL